MHIFIDESGVFTGATNISAVGALVIPDENIASFTRLYPRLRAHLPKDKGEVKGRLMNEGQILALAKLLKTMGALLFVVVVDSTYHTEDEVTKHKLAQADLMMKYITPDHPESLRNQMTDLQKQLRDMSNQLYVQSCAIADLIYRVMNISGVYFSLRRPKELGEYHWIIDAKGKDSVTPWEQWWSLMVVAMIESKSFREPMIGIEGGDYSWQERFQAEPSDWKLQFGTHDEKSSYFSLTAVLREDFRFSSDPEPGLEAVDILVNATRRALTGNLGRPGWLALRELMVDQLSKHCINFITLGAGDVTPTNTPYGKVLVDFRTAGKQLLLPKPPRVRAR